MAETRYYEPAFNDNSENNMSKDEGYKVIGEH
jgi:hypothetical protein